MVGPAPVDGVLRVEAGEVLADDLLGPVALDPLGPGVPGGDVALRVEHEDGVVGRPVDEQPELVGLVPGPLLLPEERDEAPHLGPDDDRRQRLHQDIDRTQGVAPLDLSPVDAVLRQEDDRRGPRAPVGPDRLGRLEPAEAGQSHVEQDDGELLGLGPVQRLLARAGLHEVMAEVSEDRPQRGEVGRSVIRQQDAGPLGRGVRSEVQGFRQFHLGPPSG